MTRRGGQAERETGGEANEGNEDVVAAAEVAKGVIKAVAEFVDRVTKQEATSWNLREGPQERSSSVISSSRHRRRNASGESTKG